jgi:hypothetical protein
MVTNIALGTQSSTTATNATATMRLRIKADSPRQTSAQEPARACPGLRQSDRQFTIHSTRR